MKKNIRRIIAGTMLAMTAFSCVAAPKFNIKKSISVLSRSQMEYDLYGTYEPLTITITHVLNAKSGLGWTSNSHTGLPVPVFALGAGQDQFKGFYENTEIYRKLASLTKVSR